MENSLPSFDPQIVGAGIDAAIREERAGENGYDAQGFMRMEQMENKLDLEQFKDLPKGPWRDIGEGVYVWDANDQTILEVRGWGHLRNQLGEDEAVRIQTLIGKAAAAIPDLLAEVKELRETIEKIRKMAGAALINVDEDNGGPGCCETIADILVELEDK